MQHLCIKYMPGLKNLFTETTACYVVYRRSGSHANAFYSILFIEPFLFDFFYRQNTFSCCDSFSITYEDQGKVQKKP